MLTLLIASAFIIGCICALECPDGTLQVGDAGAIGTSQCSLHQLGLSTIEDCQAYVEGLSNSCTSFTFDSNAPAVGYAAGTSYCTAYRYGVVNGIWGSSNPRSDQILCAIPIECPSDTTQNGPMRQLGAQQCDLTVRSTIEECQNYCGISNSCHIGGNTCQSFSYSTARKRCILYHTQDKGSLNGIVDEILCAVTAVEATDIPDPECPENTEQISTTGTFFQATPLTQMWDKKIEECRDYCLGYYDSRRGACTAIAFDNDYQTDDGSPSFCRLYSVNGETQTGQLTSGYRADQILCRLLDIFPEGSSAIAGLLNFDGLDVTDNGNGKFVQISAYVVHGIVCLVFVNIVCLLVYFWNKRKSDTGKYKVVSMRSDIDEEMEVN